MSFFDTGWCPSRRIRRRLCLWSPTDAGFVPWQARHRGQCQMLLSASTAATHPTLSRQQVAACSQCCSPNRLQHTQVRSGAESGDASFTGWMPMTVFGSEWVHYVYKCLQNMAPGYRSTLCQPVSSIPDQRHLRWARRGVNLATYILQEFAFPHLATVYLTVSRTLILHYKPSRHRKTFLFLHILLLG